MAVEQEFGDQVTFVGVPGRSDDVEAKADFLNATGSNTFPTLTNGDALWDAFGVTSQGTYVFVNQDGTWEAIRRPSSLSEHLTELINS